MDREQRTEQEKEFIEKQWACLQHEASMLQESYAYEYLQGRQYDHEDKGMQSNIGLVLQSPVGQFLTDRIQKDPFLSQAHVVSDARLGPLVTASLGYNVREVFDFASRKKIITGYDRLSVTAFPDSTLLIDKSSVSVGTDLHTPPSIKRVRLAEPEWRKEEELMDVLYDLYT